MVKFHLSSRNSEILHLGELLLWKSYKVLAKKVQKSYLSLHWKVMQSLKKNWLVVVNLTWVVWWIFTQPFKFHFTNFVQSIWDLSQKKYREAIFHDTEQWCKIWMNPDLVVSKMAWVIQWIESKSEKLYIDGLFLKNFRGIMCHDIEGWCKI